MTYNPEPEIAHYLERLSNAARDLPKGRRSELVAEIEQHIHDAMLETPVDSEADMLTLLDRIGDPEEISAAAGGPTRAPRSTAMERWAIILLLIGGFLWFIGWIAGVVLLWSSSLWTRRDKLIGTLVVPGGLATAIVAIGFTLAGGVGAQVCSSGPLSSPLGGERGAQTTYAQAVQYAKGGHLTDVVFRPRQQEIDATYEGKTIAVNYPTAQSATQFQHLLARQHIPFDSSGAIKETCTGGASTIEVIGLLLALAVLLIGPIVTAIYLGRRLNKEKQALAAAT